MRHQSRLFCAISEKLCNNKALLEVRIIADVTMYACCLGKHE